MFRSSYQTGSAGVEVFSSAGKDPLKSNSFSITGAVSKDYSRSSKGYIFALLEPNAVLNIPNNKKESSLGLIQSYLVIQLLLEPQKHFTFEIVVLDAEKRRFRLHYSTTFRTIEFNEFHVQIPINPNKYMKWTNFIIPLADIVQLEPTGRRRYASIESMIFRHTCQLRKIFTMPFIKSDDEHFPTAFEFLAGTDKNRNEVTRLKANKIRVKTPLIIAIILFIFYIERFLISKF
jgi:hypothetical protein